MHTFVLAAWLLAPIIGGDADDTDVAVVNVTIGGGQCSGVVVAPDIVLTAAHCYADGPGSVDAGGETIAIVETWVDRAYDGHVDHDMAALHLAHATAVAPLPFAAAQLGAVRLVGFGATQPGGARGVRHAVTTSVTEIAAYHLFAGAAGATTCIGDSGGAAIDPSGALVGIVSAGDDQCAGESQLARPDTDPDLARVIAAWTSPCAATSSCTSCDFGNDCDPSCTPVDLDCPLGGTAGTTCATNLDCESRACLPAPDAPDRGAFCTVECTTAADCPSPLGACIGGTCAYLGATPGIAGAECADDGECRSALCDVSAGVCTVPCGANDACPAGLVCEPLRARRACTLESGCAAGGGTPGAILVLVIAPLISPRRRGKSR